MVHPGLAGINPDDVINKNSPIPLHYQLEQFLRDGISNGRFPQRQTLPTEQELQAYFDLSRTPIRQAINNLVHAGLVERRRSLGTVVLPRHFEESLQSLTSFTEEVIRKGQQPHSRMVNFHVQKADADDIAQLTLKPGDDIYCIRRLRSIDGQPIGLIQSRIPVTIVPGLTANIFSEEGPHQSMYFVLETVYNIKLVRAVEVFSATNLDEETAELLELPVFTAVLQRKRVTFDTLGRAIALERGLYHAWYHMEWNGREVKDFRETIR